MATQREVAKYLDTSEHVIRDLTRVGVLEKGSPRGGFNLDQCRVAYIRYLRGSAKGKAPAPEGDERETKRQMVVDNIAVEKARHAAEMADKLAMENAQRRRELVPVAELRNAMATAGTLIRSRLETLPAQMKRRLPFLRASDLSVVKQEITKLSDELASIQLNDQDAA